MFTIDCVLIPYTYANGKYPCSSKLVGSCRMQSHSSLVPLANQTRSLTMRKLFLFALCIGLTVQFCWGQSAVLNIPRQSQHAVLTQRIGITDITVNYHRPLANNRKIWGNVVPYGQVWRAGAN